MSVIDFNQSILQVILQSKEFESLFFLELEREFKVIIRSFGLVEVWMETRAAVEELRAL